jgi:F-type H+-transporting ATPase subunit a
MSLLVIVLIVIFASIFIPRLQELPGKRQNMVEAIYEAIIDLIAQIAGNEIWAKRIFPLVAALFVYIGVANLIGLVPGLTSITYNDAPLLRTPTSDFNTTLGLALGVVAVIQAASISDWGFFGYLGRFFKFKEVYLGFKKGLGAGAMAIVEFLIGLLDIFAEFAKVISLSFRLFGNMFAGEVLALLILGAFAYVIPSAWLTMNILFAVVQTVVFGALAAAYYTLALKPLDTDPV